jgi:hypothetical protein
LFSNGKVLEYITTGVNFDDFKSRLQKALAGEETNGDILTPLPSAQPLAQPDASSAKEEDEHKETEAERKARIAKAKGKQRAVEPESAATVVAKEAQANAAAELRKKKREDRQELERIQALIEADKKARRQRREEERAARQTTAPQPQAAQLASTSRRAPATGKSVNLQVRLFDGSTMRSSFPPSATLAADVRPWVDKALKSLPDAQSFPPYNFKQILAPLPSRTIDVSDEARQLDQLDLYPSATLVVVPVADYTEAYADAGGQGLLGYAYKGINGLWGMGSSALGTVGGVLGTVTGYNSAQPVQPEQEQPAAQEAGATAGDAANSRIRVRTLADQRAESKNSNQQFYNGNQVKKDSELWYRLF